MKAGKVGRWLLAACAAGLLYGAPAEARVFSVMPANSNEEPADAFADTDALYAIGTVDAFGGRVCVIRPDQDEHASCDGPAWGTPNSISGFGTFIRPIEAPKLISGTWRLLGDNGNPATNVVSEVFSVDHCVRTEDNPCDIRIGLEAVQAYKAAADGMLDGTRATCLASQLISAIGDSPGPKQVIKRSAVVTATASGAAITVFGTGGGMGFAAYLDLALAMPSHEKALQLLQAISCRARQMYADIVADPPDEQFLTPPALETTPPFPTGEPAGDAMAQALERHVAHGRAQLKAYERYQGAVLAGSELGVHMQSRAIAEHGFEAVHAARDAAAALREYGEVLAADADVADPVTTPEQLQEIADIYARTRDTGFTAGERQELTDLGLSDDQIAGLRADIAATDIASAPTDRSARDALDDMAAALEARAPGFDQFARDAWAVAAATNHAPTGGFTADPVSSEGSGYAFGLVADNHDDDVDPLEFTWSFDDGETTTGRQVTHTFDEPGDHTVSLTTSDGIDSVTRSQTLSVKGRLVIETATAPRDPRVVAITVTGPPPASGPLYDGSSWVVDLDDGDYSLQLTPDDGAHIATLTCDDGRSARPSDADAGAGTLVARVETGETVRCHVDVVHDAPARLVLENRVQSATIDPMQRWSYTGGPPFGTRALAANESASVDVWPGGRLDVNLARREPGYRLQDVACDGGGATADPAAASVAFSPEAGETIRCIFTWRADALVSPGPLRRVWTTPELGCAVSHVLDAKPSFFDDTACGTFLSAGGTTYGPSDVPAGPTGLPRFDLVEQSAPEGAGTRRDPLTVVTEVTAGDTGLRIRQTDTYVIGEEAYKTSVRLTNDGDAARTGQLYRAADCYLQDSDAGFGDVDVDTGGVACQNAVGDGTGQYEPGERIEQWYPLTAGSRYFEAHYATVWGYITEGRPFDDTCACASRLDNGAGLSWPYSLAPGASFTAEHLTTFSPVGRRPLAVTERAIHATVGAGGRAEYEIEVENPNATAVGLTALLATLPPGFTYVPGSSSVATAADPQQQGRSLTWTGPLTVPAGGTLALRFAATAAIAAGAYDSEAAADPADPYVAVPTGPTARVTVTADETAPTVDLRTPPEGARYDAGTAVGADYSCADAGSGIASCTGTAADGAVVDTMTAGARAFEVTAVDRAGNRTVVRHAYEVLAAPSATTSPTPTPTPHPTATATPTPKPTVQVKSEEAVSLGLPASRRCVSRRRFPIRLRAPKGMRLKSARVWVDGNKATVSRKRGRLVATIDLRGLRKGRFAVLVRAVTTDGRKVRDTRRYKTCARRR